VYLLASVIVATVQLCRHLENANVAKAQILLMVK